MTMMMLMITGVGEEDGALGLPWLPKQPSPCLVYPLLLLLVLLLLLPLVSMIMMVVTVAMMVVMTMVTVLVAMMVR